MTQYMVLETPKRCIPFGFEEFYDRTTGKLLEIWPALDEVDPNDMAEAFEDYDAEVPDTPTAWDDTVCPETVIDMPETMPAETDAAGWATMYAAIYQVLRVIWAVDAGFCLRLVRTRTNGYYVMMSSGHDGTQNDYDIPMIHVLIPMTTVYLCAMFDMTPCVEGFHALGYDPIMRQLLREGCTELHRTYARIILALQPREGE